MSKARATRNWTATPVQVIIGRRIGFRYHWRHWAGGLAFMFVVGLVKGIKIEQARQARRSRGAG